MVFVGFMDVVAVGLVLMIVVAGFVVVVVVVGFVVVVVVVGFVVVVVVVGFIVVVVVVGFVVVVVVATIAEQVASFPTAARLILFKIRMAALFSVVSPVGVPVWGRITAGLE